MNGINQQGEAFPFADYPVINCQGCKNTIRHDGEAAAATDNHRRRTFAQPGNQFAIFIDEKQRIAGLRIINVTAGQPDNLRCEMMKYAGQFLQGNDI